MDIFHPAIAIIPNTVIMIHTILDIAMQVTPILLVERIKTRNAKQRDVITPTKAVWFNAFTVVSQLNMPWANHPSTCDAFINAFQRSKSTCKMSVGGFRVYCRVEFIASDASLTWE
jgi:hypothetical protein